MSIVLFTHIIAIAYKHLYRRHAVIAFTLLRRFHRFLGTSPPAFIRFIFFFAVKEHVASADDIFHCYFYIWCSFIYCIFYFSLPATIRYDIASYCRRRLRVISYFRLSQIFICYWGGTFIFAFGLRFVIFALRLIFTLRLIICFSPRCAASVSFVYGFLPLGAVIYWRHLAWYFSPYFAGSDSSSFLAAQYFASLAAYWLGLFLLKLFRASMSAYYIFSFRCDVGHCHVHVIKRELAGWYIFFKTLLIRRYCRVLPLPPLIFAGIFSRRHGQALVWYFHCRHFALMFSFLLHGIRPHAQRASTHAAARPCLPLRAYCLATSSPFATSRLRPLAASWCLLISFTLIACRFISLVVSFISLW